ncbi:MAG: pilus assembly protein TadB, partial [Sphingopyxis sp.]|nr:pilus assembly protein TadB [Sphingopyxis sp.]
MNMPVIITIIASFVGLMLLGLALIGPSAGKAKTRRLSAVKDRHAASTEAVVAAQMRKTIAQVGAGGANSLASFMPRRDLMELRLRRTGKNWTLSNFMMACMAAFVGVAALLVLLGAPILLTGLVAAFAAIGVPHFYV